MLKALTGVFKEEFDSLIPVFEQSVLEDKKLRGKALERRFGGGKKGNSRRRNPSYFSYFLYSFDKIFGAMKGGVFFKNLTLGDKGSLYSNFRIIQNNFEIFSIFFWIFSDKKSIF